MVSMFKAQTQPAPAPAPAPTPLATEKPSEFSSTTEALAQLRLKRREESKGSSETRAPTLQQLEAEAAPLEESAPEPTVEAKSGTHGKISHVFITDNFSSCYSITIKIERNSNETRTIKIERKPTLIK